MCMHMIREADERSEEGRRVAFFINNLRDSQPNRKKKKKSEGH